MSYFPPGMKFGPVLTIEWPDGSYLVRLDDGIYRVHSAWLRQTLEGDKSKAKRLDNRGDI
jgi:hypothetical protein